MNWFDGSWRMRLPVRKRRRRFRPNWGAVLFVALCGNAVAGMVYSPLTAVTSVKVAGVPEWDQARVESILAKAQSIPSARLPVRALESQLLQASAVQSADLRRNLFGRAELKLQYRTPIARLSKPAGVAIDSEGAFFSVPALDSKLPTILGPADGWERQLTTFGSWPKARVAKLCSDVELIVPGESFSVELEAGGRLCLTNVGGADIELGPCDGLDAKLAALKGILDRDPSLLSRVRTVNLSVPEKPAMTPKPPIKP